MTGSCALRMPPSQPPPKRTIRVGTTCSRPATSTTPECVEPQHTCTKMVRCGRMVYNGVGSDDALTEPCTKVRRQRHRVSILAVKHRYTCVHTANGTPRVRGESGSRRRIRRGGEGLCFLICSLLPFSERKRKSTRLISHAPVLHPLRLRRLNALSMLWRAWDHTGHRLC